MQEREEKENVWAKRIVRVLFMLYKFLFASRHTLSPLPADYLQPSERSLTVILLQGSVAHKDPCMLGFDMITCIEL